MSAKPIHTEVVVVGNGPSAISLSYMLSGNRPFYDGSLLSNEYLTKRLQQDIHVSLADKELEPLCEGLEGRSHNPVALLFDNLHHPDADLGADIPAALSWKHDADYRIPHVVLGKTRPGGTWQKIDGLMQTISQNTWMELPSYPFKEWLAKKHRSQPAESVLGRATISDIKEYYLDFVETRNLTDNFHDYHTVTSVQRVFHLRNKVDNESGEIEPCCPNIRGNHTHIWEVRGYKALRNELGETVGREDFCYVAHSVVLATGAYDLPNRLGVEGENLPNVVHCLADFEKLLTRGYLNNKSDPLLVVGAGLSAADTILMALSYNVPIIHMFRTSPIDPSLIFSRLPKTMYPEYQHVHSLMKGKETSELYKPLPRHQVDEIKSNKVLLRAKKTDALTTFDVSYVAIMIGSRCDLGFLPRGGKDLGVVPEWPIDSKHNPVDVDAYSYQSFQEPSLFAMGPLIGDNFVRFGIGGALGIVNHLNKCRRKEGI